jgi:hypothetical protein
VDQLLVYVRCRVRILLVVVLLHHATLVQQLSERLLAEILPLIATVTLPMVQRNNADLLLLDLLQ